jgi:hypothetical protein
MARTVTRSTLRDRIRQRTDTVNSTFVSDAELNAWIDDALAEYRDAVVASFGEDYYTTSTTFTTTAGNQSYALGTVAPTFYKLSAVYVRDGNFRCPTLKATLRDLLEDTRDGGWSFSRGYSNVTYRIIGDNISFAPIPAGVHTVELWFMPAAPTLANDSATMDGIDGWDEFVVAVVAVRVAIKEESDPSGHMDARSRAETRIRSMADPRDESAGDYVQDTYYRGSRTGLPPEWRR